jgi:superoxide dismutase, Cu-Zn family
VTHAIVLGLALVTASCARDTYAEPGRASPGSPGESLEAVGRVHVDPGRVESGVVHVAIAVLTPARDSHVSGTVRFVETADGLEVRATVDALPAGAHPYAVHVFGDCTAPDAWSAGPRFSYLPTPARKAREAGQLGVLRDDGRLTTTHASVIRGATLHGKYSLIGRAVVVHAATDGGRPTRGKLGRRLACGVIGIPHHDAPRTASHR